MPLVIGPGVSPMNAHKGTTLNLLPKLKEKFTADFSDVAVYCNTTEYIILVNHLYKNKAIGWVLGNKSLYVAGQLVPGIIGVKQLTKVRGLSRDNVGITWSGTFTNATSVSAYKGIYKRSNIAGNYSQFVAPLGSTDVGMFGFGVIADNSGIGLVTINGDATLANLLPTAQDLVDAGKLVSTALVANGGTLNPTDRVVDQNSTVVKSDTSGYIRFADNLNHLIENTVRVTVTPYKNTTSTDNRLYFSGFYYANETGNLADTDTVLLEDADYTISSINEFAISYKPTGAASLSWMGHSGTILVSTASIKVDGSVITPARYGIYAGSLCTIDLACYSRHSELGATDITTFTRQYNFNNVGLALAQNMVWNVLSDVVYAYPTMMAMAESFNRGRVKNGSNLTLTANDGNYYGNAKSDYALLWQQSGKLGSMLSITDLTKTVNNYDLASIRQMDIEDRSDGIINKVYATKIESSTAVQVNDVWEMSVLYQSKYFDSGAESELA